MQILQPVQRDYAAQILTVPTGTRMMYDQPQSTPLAVVGQPNRPTLGNLSLLCDILRVNILYTDESERDITFPELC